MQSLSKGFRVSLMAAGLVWLGSGFFIDWEFESTPPRAPLCVVAGLPAPLVMLPSLGGSVTSDGFPHEICATRIGREGGLLQCGPAQLLIMPETLTSSNYFCLEDLSDHMPCVELTRSTGDLTRAVRLSISYRGTPYEESGFDLSAFRVYRQVSETQFEPLPSHVDLHRCCVVADVTQGGLYIIA